MADKPITFWMIKAGNGKILAWHIETTRKKCIKEFLKDTVSPWLAYKKMGFSCVKVEIREMEP